MESCLDFFNNYIMGMIQMLAGFHYYTGFLNRRAQRQEYLLFALFGIVVISVIRDNGIGSFLAYILMLMFWGFFVCRAGFAAVVLYAVVLGEMMQLCYGIFDSVLCMIHPMLFSFPKNFVSILFVILGNTAVIAVVCCGRVMNRYFACDETMNGQCVALILVPTLLIFLVSEYIHFTVYGNTVTLDDRGNLINANHDQMFLIQLLGIGSLFCIMAAYKKLLENVRFHTEISLLRQQEHFMNQYVEEAKTRYESTRSFRHDMKNHITVVRELLQSGKWSQALDYVSDMEEMTGEMAFPCSTGNPVVDILVGNKLGIARRNDIDVSCSLMLPYPCPIRDIDFCIILSNALDNAICACKNMDLDRQIAAEKYIRVTGDIQGDFVLIEVENSFAGGGAFREGTGLSNIRKVAEQYQGAVNIKTEVCRVILSVLLIIS